MFNKIGQFFSMTRRERIGTLIVAVLLALAVVAVFCVKSCARNTSIPADVTTQIQEFKQQVETTDSLSTQHKSHKKSAYKSTDKHKTKEHKGKANRQKGTGGSSSPRRFDDVPTF